MHDGFYINISALQGLKCYKNTETILTSLWVCDALHVLIHRTLHSFLDEEHEEFTE